MPGKKSRAFPIYNRVRALDDPEQVDPWLNGTLPECPLRMKGFLVWRSQRKSSKKHSPK
jgi:hypothetical protein